MIHCVNHMFEMKALWSNNNFIQKIIEKGVIAFLGNNAQNLVLPVISFIFFCALVGMFLVIFKFAELLQTVI